MKKVTSIILCIIMAMFVILSGCSNKSASPGSDSQGTQAPSTAESSDTDNQGEPVTLSMFAALNSKSAQTVTSYADILAMQETEKATNVKIDWIQPPVGEEKDQFNLMVASMQLPDMIAWTWWSYPGGPEKAISDGLLIALDDHMQSAPALSAIYEQYPELKKQVTTDTGKTYFFPRINGDALDPAYHTQSFWVGPVYRADIVEALGLDEPKTIDDWYELLKAVKAAYPDMIPLAAADGTTANTSLYTWASIFGTRPNFYMDNGKVNFGLLSDTFRNYVETMAKWYSEGLIDPDYLANDGAALKAKVTSGNVFAFIGSQGGNYVSYAQAMETGLPDAQLKIASWPTGPDGKAYTSQAGVTTMVNSGFGIGITPDCEDVQSALKYLDYGYTDEGILLNNFGVEGVTYNNNNGEISWTDDIKEQIANSTTDLVIGKYAVVSISTWASLTDVRTFKLFRTYPGQYEAGEIWGQASDSLDMPPLTPTEEESPQIATITNNVTTYRDEMIAKIIMGQLPVSYYDTILDEVKGMGIEEAVDIYNDALERYNQR